MKKKFILILIAMFLVISCGKKGDPQYKNSKVKHQFKITKNI